MVLRKMLLWIRSGGGVLPEVSDWIVCWIIAHDACAQCPPGSTALTPAIRLPKGRCVISNRLLWVGPSVKDGSASIGDCASDGTDGATRNTAVASQNATSDPAEAMIDLREEHFALLLTPS